MELIPGSTSKCPHCGVSSRFEEVHLLGRSRKNFNEILPTFNLRIEDLENTTKGYLSISHCTACKNIIILYKDKMIYPFGASRPPCSAEVPKDIAQDYSEACLVEPFSKKASAALSRRCLQNMLHERGITEADLSKEIDKAMQSLPSHLSYAIDNIRVIGNFAAHPIKETNTGEIVEVEEGEAEWALDTLEQLFDFYYVQPALTEKKKNALNAKLQAAGKPPLK